MTSRSRTPPLSDSNLGAAERHFICSHADVRDLFVHDRAAVIFGASVFWVRPAAILIGTLDEFVAHWQVKRDKTRRGIVEVIP